MFVFFFQAEDGIRDLTVTGVQTCALPISGSNCADLGFGWSLWQPPESKIGLSPPARASPRVPQDPARPAERSGSPRSEEHTSELQSQSNLVCRLLLEKKKNNEIKRKVTSI